MTEGLLQAIGLDHNPFSSAACTTGYFQTMRTKSILEELYYGITSRKGFLVLEGEVGVGKTSLLYQLLAMLEKEKLSTAWVFNTILERKDLLLAIAKDFELPVTDSMSLAHLLEQLNTFFLEQYNQGYNSAIIIDEAHNLGAPALEALRMLSNLESEGHKLVQILLVGQPELKQLIDQPNLRQLRSRIGIYLTLDTLSCNDTKRYVDFKLSNAGSELPVSSRAYTLLWHGSRGNTRMINLIMERALYAIMAFGKHMLNTRIMRAALKEIAGYQTDVARALRTRFIKIATGWTLALCAGLFIAGLIPIIPVSTGQTSVAQLMLHSLHAAPTKTLPHKQPSPVTQPTSVSQKAPVAASATIKHRNKDLTNLLLKYRLQNLLPILDRAVATKDLDLIRQTLPTDLQLIGLQTLPSTRDVLFTYFPWKKYTGQDPAWIVVWKPALTITDFYPYYKSKEIASLQAMLKVLDYYSGAIDGIVGPVMWKGINNFQKKMGLDRSAAPDPKTIFLIYAAYKAQKGTS